MPPGESDPAASLIEAADEGLAGVGSAADQASPAQDDNTHEPVEKDARQGNSKARPKRPAHEAARKTGRPSVPAWDEIMFGSRPGIDRSSH
jgi:hypothetical protein